MTREQAINYLISSGFSDEQVSEVVRALTYEPTPKNDLGVDCISRQAVIDLMMQKWGENFSGDSAMQESIDAIRVMPPVTPQEPKPMVEIDLYSVIKQKYIEREVLDKLRVEIEQTEFILDKSSNLQDDRTDTEKFADWSRMFKMLVLNIIDKYKLKTEVEDGATSD